MFGISGFELLLIALFVLVIFGPDKLPELARTFGKAMRTFKNAQEEMERVIKAEVYAPNRPVSDSGEEASPAVDAAAATQAASAVWSATDEDDEEEDEE